MGLFFTLTAGFLATQVLIPHLDGFFPGYLGPWTQSILVLAEAGLLYMAFRRYRKERGRAADSLTDSFRYIGIANRQMEIIQEFAEGLHPMDTAETVRQRIGTLLGQISAAGLGADQALLRLVDGPSGKTLTEWTWTRSGRPSSGQLKIANRQLIQGCLTPGRESCLFVDRSSGTTTLMVLAAALPPGISPSLHQETFIRTMLRLIHITVLSRLLSRHGGTLLEPQV